MAETVGEIRRVETSPYPKPPITIRKELRTIEGDPIRQIENALYEAKAETREEGMIWSRACSRLADFRNGWTSALWFEKGDIRHALSALRWAQHGPTPIEIRQEDPQRYTLIEDRPTVMLVEPVTVNEASYLMPPDNRTYVSQAYSERVLKELGVLKEGEPIDSLANLPKGRQRGDWGPIYNQWQKTAERVPTNIPGVDVSVNLDWPYGIKATFSAEALAIVVSSWHSHLD